MGAMKTKQVPQYINLPAGADLSAKEGYFLALSSGQTVVAGAGAAIVGVNDDKPDVAGKMGRVQIGGVAVVLAGGVCTVDQAAASDSNGKAVNASGSARQIGVFLESGVAGDRLRMLMLPVATAQAVDYESPTSGALNTGVPTSFLSITGAQAFTLADGTSIGQRKNIEVTTAASSPVGTLTINDPFGSEPATHVFTTVGQRLELEWRSGGWKVIGKRRVGALTVVVGTDVLTGNDMVDTYNLSITGTVSSTTTKGIPDGQLAGESIWLRCTTAASTPNGSIAITAKTFAGAAATAAAVNATTDYEYLRWDGAAWQEQITNSVTLS